MIDKKLDKEILDYLTNGTGKLVSQRCLKSILVKRNYYDYLMQRYSDNVTDTFNESIYRLYNHIETVPTCKICGNPVKFTNNAYSTYCCAKCRNNDPDVLKKNKEGVSRALKNAYKNRGDEIKKKRENTLTEKYGEDGKSSSPFAYSKVQNQIKSIVKEKYGVENVFELERFRGDTKKRFREKSVNLWKSRGMTIKYTNNDTVIIKDACSLHGDVEIPIYVFERRTRGPIPHPHHYCLQCFPLNMSSFPEDTIKHILDEKNIEYVMNTRRVISPLELDFYIEPNIGIEINGIYYHSENANTPRNYHKIKSDACDKNNIQLIHIWEDQLDNKLDVVKSSLFTILNKIKPSDLDFDFSVLGFESARNFYNENSLFNFDTSSIITVALTYDNVVYKAMSLSLDKNNSIYINNICTRKNTSLSHDKNYNKDLLEFAVNKLNKRGYNISTKDVYAISQRDFYITEDYTELGLTQKTLLNPTFSWVKSSERIDVNREEETIEDKNFVGEYFKCYNSGKIKWEKPND